jgi:hypothetical protein
MTNLPHDERREFFRIEDEIYLHYDLLNESEYSQAIKNLAQTDDSPFNLCRHYAWLCYEASQTLSTLEPDNPGIMKYLEILNNKIDLLAQHTFQALVHCNQADKIRATISASGLTFECQEPIPANHPIRVKILLLPENHHVLALGRVRHTDHSHSSNAPLVNIEFEHLHPIDMELMVRHNINKQKQNIRARK